MNGVVNGVLARIVGDALKSLDHAVESTNGDRQDGMALSALAGRVAGDLVARGVAPDEPAHVRIGNRPSDLGSLLGVWQAGAVAVPVHVSAVPRTLERLQGLTRARFSVDGERIGELGRLAPPERALLRDAALVIFTSGSTGEPKGVVIGHRGFADKLAVLDRLLGVRAEDVVLSPLRLTFIFGLWVSLLTLMKGARLVLVPEFARDAMERRLAGATVLAGVPSMFRALLTQSAPSAPRLRLILTGGEVLPPKLAHAMQGFAGAAIHDLYGLTETGSCDFCLGPADQPGGFGTIGKPTEQVMFRLVQDGCEVAAGETGELRIRTPFRMLGYLDDAKSSQASFDDGYFKTGDLARLTASGNVELVGRCKDIVSRGGYKIAPLEIDNLLSEHPDIAAALCAGVADERLGEVVHAVIVRRAGARLDGAALRDWLLARTERFKVPDVFHFRDALPCGPTGKADRGAIARLAATSTGGDAT
jgi:long-chain acyl-CoA synthetase